MASKRSAQRAKRAEAGGRALPGRDPLISRRELLSLGVAGAVAGCAGVPVRSSRGGSLAGKVEHLLVLMMENRSYDQMLGAIHDGVEPGRELTYEGGSVRVRYGAPLDKFPGDPPHNFRAVKQQLSRSNGGFLETFVAKHGPARIEEYATLYAEGRLPILHGLARHYGVCTRWFCSVPGPTIPNRMFVHAGTSAGVTRQGIYYTRIRNRTIFDQLGGDPNLWAIYSETAPNIALTGTTWMTANRRSLRDLHRLKRDVLEDRLATYSFIEPNYILNSNCQHPRLGKVSNGEKLIAEIYGNLIANPEVFAKSMLVIVYDEHGGFYDHVEPPAALPPDDIAGDQDDFAFDRLGPRVPAVVISPWIEKGSAFDATFDHTSIPATVERMTGIGVDSRRAKSANTLEGVLNRSTPRRDAVGLEFDRDAYGRCEADEIVEADPDGDVADQIRAAFCMEHGREASDEEIAAHYRWLTAE